ncbi:MAG: hypothetical protein ACPGGK_09060 [Pikeienuella sp.]
MLDQIQDIELRDFITILISFAALALSFWATLRTGRLNREHLQITSRQGEAENRIAAAQADLAREQTRMARDSDIIHWAADVTGLLSQMAELTMVQSDDVTWRRDWHLLRHQLTAKIDVGRLYFPNYAADMVNLEKPPAYRGVRQSVIDHLVWAYDAFSEYAATSNETDMTALRGRLISEKRQFISEIQTHIDPMRYIEMLDTDALDEVKKSLEETPLTPEEAKK